MLRSSILFVVVEIVCISPSEVVCKTPVKTSFVKTHGKSVVNQINMFEELRPKILFKKYSGRVIFP